MTDLGQSHDRALRDVLRNTAAEIARLSALISPVETVLENVSVRKTSADRAVLQNLDLVMQTIDTVAAFLNQVSDDVSADIMVNVGPALTQVYLEAVRYRLAARPASGERHQVNLGSRYLEAAVRSGHPELF